MMRARADRLLMSLRPVHVAAGAMLTALTFSLLVFPLIAGPLQANLDPDRFGELGTNIALGKGFVYGSGDSRTVAFDRAPVYPLIVALMRVALDERYVFGLQVLQALLHGLTGLLVYRIARQFADHPTAVLAQLIHALHPVMVWYTARVWIETTNTSITVLVVLMVIRLQDSVTIRRTVMAGVVIGVAVLTKAIILFLPVVFIIAALVRKQWRSARALCAAMLVAIMVVAPWTVRNAMESGRFIPVHTSLGLNLMLGEAISRHWTDAPFSTLTLWEKGHAAAMQILAGTGHEAMSPEGDAMLVRGVAVGWLRDPVAFVRHVAVNAVTFWYLSESTLKSLVLLALQLPLLLCAVRGARDGRGRSPAAMAIILTVLYFWGVHAVIVGWLRYAVPVMPLVILLAVAGLTDRSARTMDEPAY
jgi:4-amino-4-deoxy-L-arabinose transferase-like glycosyltransferase